MNIEALFPAIIIICICYIGVLISIICDLWSGVRKAKKAGIARMSKGFRRTIEKICSYYNGLFALLVVDGISLIVLDIIQIKGYWVSIPLIPAFTVAGSLYIAYIEIRSVYEKLEDKQKHQIQTDMKILSQIVNNAEKLEKIMKILNAKEKKA